MVSVDGLTSTEIRELMKQGKKVGGINAFMVLPVEKLDDVISGNEGFILAPNFEKPLKNYSQYHLALNKKTAAIHIGWKSINSQSERNACEIEAYVKKYGFNNLVFEDELDQDLFFINHDRLKAMTKEELKTWYVKCELEIKGVNWQKTKDYNLELILKSFE